MNFHQQLSPEKYSTFVDEFVFLLDNQFTKWEEQSNDPNNLNSLATQVPSMISLVNTLSCLRGDDGVFNDVRPPGVDNNKLLTYEREFKERLAKITEKFMRSEAKEWYLKTLQNYLISPYIR